MEDKLPSMFMTIDPGINIGAAIFKYGKFEPLLTKSIIGDQKKWEVTSQLVLHQYKIFLQPLKSNFPELGTIYIEQPQYMDSFIGRTAATSGSLFKLCCIYGAMFYISRELGFSIIPLEITKWKGQMTKEMVANRVFRKLGKHYENHICDAVGMGLHLKGIL